MRLPSSYLIFYKQITLMEAVHFLLIYCYRKRSRGSAVGIATGYGLDDWGVGVRVPVRLRIFSPPNCPDRLWSPPNLLSNGYRGALSLGVKRKGHEADHLTPASAEVKKMWIYTSTPPYDLMAQYLIHWAHGQLYLTVTENFNLRPRKLIKNKLISLVLRD
jgi:hypothetical protein